MAIITMTPKGPLHIGQFVGVEGEAALDYVPSDTLFGALVEAWKQVGLDVSGRLAPFEKNTPPFLISSVFPRAGEVCFYPRPWVTPNPPGVLQGKQAKKVRWVSEKIFNRLITGQIVKNASDEPCLLQAGTVWVMPDEREAMANAVDIEQDKWWQVQVVPRVTVGRAANRSNLFHAGRMTFAPGVGLWFAATDLTGLPNPSGLEDIKTALAILADSGLGGLRSAGHGAFEYEWGDSPHPHLLSGEAKGNYAVTLARYAPRSADEVGRSLKADHAAYQLVLVGGWCRDDNLHPWRRKNVRMVTEGSLLGVDGQTAYGGLVDVTPDNVRGFGERRRVYRYGFAFPVAVTADVSVQEEH